MNKKKITLIILVILFIVFSFFSCFSYQMFVKEEQQIRKNKFEERIRKNNEIHIIYQPKKEIIYNKTNNIRLNYFYSDTNIIIPGNKIASENIKQYLNLEATLDESIKEKINVLNTKNKEYILDNNISILYFDNKVISFYYQLIGEFESNMVRTFKVFSLNIHTGKKLKYQDISINQKKLKLIIKNHIMKELKQRQITAFSILSKVDREIEKENFYLDDENLVVLMPRCDLLSCLDGNVFIKIPYKDISDVLINKYY